MDNVDLNVLRQVTQWTQQGHRVVLGTITRTWGSAPRPPGSAVAIRDDGLVAGSVSGGCIEDDLIDKARGGVLASGRPQVVRYGIDADAAHVIKRATDERSMEVGDEGFGELRGEGSQSISHAGTQSKSLVHRADLRSGLGRCKR